MFTWRTWIDRVLRAFQGPDPSAAERSDGATSSAPSSLDASPIRLELPKTVSCAIVVFHDSEGPAVTDPTAFVKAELERVPDPNRMLARMVIEKGLCRVKSVSRSQAPKVPTPLLDIARLDAGDRSRLERAKHAAVFVSTDACSSPRVGLLAAMHGAKALGLATRGIVFDAMGMRILKPEDLSEPSADGPDRAEDHVEFHSSDQGGGMTWSTTKGMCKLGLPELELVHESTVPRSIVRRTLDGVSDVLLACADVRAHAKEPLEIQRDIEIPIEGRDRGVQVGLQLRPAGSSSDSFITIGPPSGVELDSKSWTRVLESSWLEIDSVPIADPRMKAAHLAAIAELPRLRAEFPGFERQGITLMVKHGAPTHEGGREYIWFQVESWAGARLSCLVANDPSSRCGLRKGQAVDIAESDVFDWVQFAADGSTSGGATSKIAHNP